MIAELPAVRIVDPPAPLPSGMALPHTFRRAVAMGAEVWFRDARIMLFQDAAFRDLWKARRLDFLRRGFALRQHNGAWYLQQWLAGSPGRYTLTVRGAETLAGMLAPAPEALPVATLPAALVLPPLPHGLEDKLFEYQRQPARQLLRALLNGKEEWGYPGAWDCSDLGTGKTYQALAAALGTGLEIGVICPRSVIGSEKSGSGWLGAFRHFGQRPLFVMNYESLRTGGKQWVRKRDKRYEWTPDPQHTILIWDEAHLLKNASQNRELCVSAMRQGFPTLCVSGTMAEQPLNLAATGRAVGLHNGTLRDYEEFLMQHGCVGKSPNWKFNRRSGGHHLARINKAVFPQRGARVRINDLPPGTFPETQIMCEAVETDETAEIAKAWAEAEAALQIMREQGKTETQIEFARRGQYARARKISELAKVDAVADMVRVELEEGRSVAVFLNFTESRERLAAELKVKCQIHGEQAGEAGKLARDEAMLAFREDMERVILVNSQAGGTGISLHDVNGDYPRTAIIMPTDNAVILGQVLGRVHRAGGKTRSRQIIVFAAGTIEEGMMQGTRQKLANISKLNDGDAAPEKSAF